MKQKFYFYAQHIALLVLLAGIAIIVFIPIFANDTAPNIADLANHLISIMQAKLALAEGQIFLRTAPSGHYSSFRYPLFQFYSPTSYTVGALIYKWVTPTNPFVAFKLTIWGMLILGSVYMYRLAYWLIKSSPIAMLAAVVYLLAPYPIIIINYIGNFNEAIAFGMLPLVVFYTLQRYYHPTSDKDLLLMALMWYLLATIHLITFVYSSLIIGILLVLLLSRELSQWRRLIHVGIAYVFGCAMAAWFLAPVVLYNKLFFVSNALGTHGSVSYLADLLSPVAHFSAGTHTKFGWDVISQINPSIGLPIFIAVGMCAYLLLNKQIEHSSRPRLLAPLVILFGIVFFAVWSPLDFWRWLPSAFGIIQYSWRLLGQLTWIGALLFAFALASLFLKQWNYRYTFVVMLVVLASSVTWLHMPGQQFKKFDFIYANNYQIFNTDSYLLDFSKSGADKVHDVKLRALHVRIDDFDKKGTLRLNATALVPRSMFNLAYAPILKIVGTIPGGAAVNNRQLEFLVNNQVVNVIRLKPGDFSWELPLSFLTKPAKDQYVSLQFKMRDAKPAPIIYSDTILLTGFLNPHSSMTLAQLHSDCRQISDGALCHIAVPDKVDLLELPVFYYPDMLNITLNGRSVPYFSVLDGALLIVGIQPEPGQTNVINIQFRGLLWANFISVMCWSLWAALVVYLGLVALIRRFANSSNRGLTKYS
jgi:hypothetical protein